VLIIGILAAIALPQYNKIIIRVNQSELASVARVFVPFANEYHLIHGFWPRNISTLPVDGLTNCSPEINYGESSEGNSCTLNGKYIVKIIHSTGYLYLENNGADIEISFLKKTFPPMRIDMKNGKATCFSAGKEDFKKICGGFSVPLDI
jgi:type II secretory pathway pseudopilin PulG